MAQQLQTQKAINNIISIGTEIIKNYGEVNIENLLKVSDSLAIGTM